jgi:Bacterial protein of unknown function (DUF885)
MKLLESFLKTEYDLPTKSENLSVIDYIQIEQDFEKYQLNLKNFLNQYSDNLTDIERKIILNEISPFRNLLRLLSQNYFTNYYHELFLQVNGIITSYNKNMEKSYDSYIDRIYDNIDQIPMFHDLIVQVYQTIINKNYPLSDKYDLKLFYNKRHIEKFIKNLDFEPPLLSTYSKNLSPEKKNKLESICQLMYITSQKTKKYMINILNSNVFTSKPSKFGLSNYDTEFYIYYLSYMCGLNFKSTSDIEYLYKWAHQLLEYNSKQIKKLVKQLCPESDLTDKSYIDICNLITSKPENAFMSKDEIKQMYQNSINVYYDFVKQYNVPLTNKCNLIIMDNPDTSAGFYINNCFFLNIGNWHKQRKHEVAALTMHETYPGHHLQIDISNNHSSTGYLARFYQNMFCAFAEGWALFAEKIYPDNDLLSKFGVLDSDMLRIVRIIADIDLHYWGKSPDEVLNKLDNILAFDRSLIEPEVNRYEIFPAQAISYKIGESAFMGIYYKLKSESESDLKINDKKIIDKYLDILLEGEVFIEDLLNKHKIGLFYQTKLN